MNIYEYKRLLAIYYGFCLSTVWTCGTASCRYDHDRPSASCFRHTPLYGPYLQREALPKNIIPAYVLYDCLLMVKWTGRNMLQYNCNEYMIFFCWGFCYSDFILNGYIMLQLQNYLKRWRENGWKYFFDHQKSELISVLGCGGLGSKCIVCLGRHVLTATLGSPFFLYMSERINYCSSCKRNPLKWRSKDSWSYSLPLISNSEQNMAAIYFLHLFSV